jgi:hypothetical protein
MTISFCLIHHDYTDQNYNLQLKLNLGCYSPKFQHPSLKKLLHGPRFWFKINQSIFQRTYFCTFDFSISYRIVTLAFMPSTGFETRAVTSVNIACCEAPFLYSPPVLSAIFIDIWTLLHIYNECRRYQKRNSLTAAGPPCLPVVSVTCTPRKRHRMKVKTFRSLDNSRSTCLVWRFVVVWGIYFEKLPSNSSAYFEAQNQILCQFVTIPVVIKI